MKLYQEIKNTMIKKGYSFYEDGDYNLNLIAIRKDNLITNHFTDEFYILYKLNGKECLLYVPCTTKAGSFKSALNGAVSVIIPNQYKKAYTWIGKGKGWGNYPFNEYFFALTGVISTWIDGNKDLVIDKVGAINISSNVGVDIHRALEHTINVDNWSKGCVVITEECFRLLIPVIEEACKRYSNIFTFTLLEAIDF